MPIIRKVLKLGHSKAITIPLSWFEFFERESGENIREVSIEIDRVLTVQPIVKNKGKQGVI
jgi:antitoxin component of MazEF toxin-antitoxin module